MVIRAESVKCKVNVNQTELASGLNLQSNYFTLTALSFKE